MFLRELEDESVSEGDTITLQTVIEAYPTIGVVWWVSWELGRFFLIKYKPWDLFTYNGSYWILITCNFLFDAQLSGINTPGFLVSEGSRM